eukprot:760646-Hanusia_phi.AAC.4
MPRAALAMLVVMAAAVALRGAMGSERGRERGGERDAGDGMCSDAREESLSGKGQAEAGKRRKKFQCMVEHGVDYPGDGFQGDLAVFRNVPSFRECCKLCKKNDRCRFWTWATPERHQARDCWLKDALVEDYRVQNEFTALLVSGYVLRNETSEQVLRKRARERLEDNKSDGQGKKRTKRKEVSCSPPQPLSLGTDRQSEKIMNHARGLLQQGRAPEAEEYLRRNFEERSKTGAYFYWLGVFLEAQQKMKEAARNLKVAHAGREPTAGSELNAESDGGRGFEALQEGLRRS